MVRRSVYASNSRAAHWPLDYQGVRIHFDRQHGRLTEAFHAAAARQQAWIETESTDLVVDVQVCRNGRSSLLACKNVSKIDKVFRMYLTEMI